MIARLGSVIYWFSLLATVAFSVAVYVTFVEEVGGSDCVLSEADQMIYSGDFVNTDLDEISDEGILCVYQMLRSPNGYTEYGDAPIYWSLGLLIALVGYSIRYVLTGIRNPLPWVSKARS